ncbi:hypothetical protein [Nocardioides sp. AE5]|uniref:hypothetical protein n=1 Tax=Nocardioides sp. AE5 TaxID=2962573 RepID=UPI002880CE31|nr:hypothetical protein [Nocardioides sp. AE5]MDT0202644.1 hypothetical protein [Nocardioides sp. AE5]
MTVEEQHRRQLQEALVDRIGSGLADTLMSYLPPVGWADVATKHDVQALRVATKQDVQVVRVDVEALRADVEALRVATKQDLDTLQAVLHAEIAELGADLRREMAEMGADLRREMAEMNAGFQAALRTQFYWTITLMVLLMTGFVAALKLV